MGVSVTTSGSFDKTEAKIKRLISGSMFSRLDRFGEMGRAALASATPTETGITASSWSYKVEKDGSGFRISWYNTNKENGFPVAIMLQYGHGTGTGGYISGRDYINPAIKPIFEQIKAEVRREVARG